MDHAEKIRQLEMIIEAEQPPDPLTHFLLGREYMEAGHFGDAARVLERCVELNPEYTAAYRFWGDAHRKAGEGAAAREVYELGISVAQRTGDLQAGKEMEAFLKKLKAEE